MTPAGHRVLVTSARSPCTVEASTAGTSDAARWVRARLADVDHLQQPLSERDAFQQGAVICPLWISTVGVVPGPGTEGDDVYLGLSICCAQASFQATVVPLEHGEHGGFVPLKSLHAPPPTSATMTRVSRVCALMQRR